MFCALSKAKGIGIIMKPLTWDTTFQEIEYLLKSKDSDFIAICKRLHSGGNRDEVYKGYRVRHFDFLMGIVLGGVQ